MLGMTSPTQELSPTKSSAETHLAASNSISIQDAHPQENSKFTEQGQLPNEQTAEHSSTPTSSTSSLPSSFRNSSAMSGPSGSNVKSSGLPEDMQAKMKAFHLSRQRMPPGPNPPAQGGPTSELISRSPSSNATPLSSNSPFAAGLRLPPGARPQPANWTSAPAVPKNQPIKPSLGARRGLKLPGGLPGASIPNITSITEQSTKSLAAKPMGSAVDNQQSDSAETGSLFNKFSDFVDTKTGTLKFAGKAVIHGKGIDFSGGGSFSISLDEIDNLEELGKGNYGTVYRVRHSRPHVRRPGSSLKDNQHVTSTLSSTELKKEESCQANMKSGTNADAIAEKAKPLRHEHKTPTTGIVMAMKEIRLELDEAKFTAIIMELDILHRCVSPFIIDFYGAFFQEGAVYICMEYMDGGSIDKLYGDGIPEAVLRKVTLSAVMGLKSLKEDHNIIHRDVKPTNMLVNTRGQVKMCDFGVSGNLVASIAKTNIGCQSYMAPERIAGGGMSSAGGTYSVQSDIWSLAVSIIECAMGRYPYPPETFNNIFSQLSAIVDGDPPKLPDTYSEAAKDFVDRCLTKRPDLRPTYSTLLRHPWLAELLKPPEKSADIKSSSRDQGPIDTADEEVALWVIEAIERKKKGLVGAKAQPALHAAPLNTTVTA